MYYKTKESVEEYIKAAADVSGAENIKRLKRHLKPSAKVLELGSGPGTDWAILNETYEVVGSDFSAEFLAKLKQIYPSGTFIELDAVSIEVSDTYDGVYSNKVLHHLRDNELKKSIERQFKALNEGGVICHTFWAGEGEEIFKGMQVTYHSEMGLKNLFEPLFDIIELDTYGEFEDGDSFMLIARKKGL